MEVTIVGQQIHPGLKRNNIEGIFFITLVPKVYNNVFLFAGLITLWTFIEFLLVVS